MGTDRHRTDRHRTLDRGATLPETLIVVVILGVLAVAVLVVVGRLRDRSVASSCASQRVALERAVLVWNQRFDDPPTVDALVEAGIIRSGGDGYELTADGELVARADGPCGSAPTPEAAAPSSEFADPSASVGSGAVVPGVSASAGDPPLEVTLSWTGNADLDLWVRTPTGELIGWTDQVSEGVRLIEDVVPASPDAVGPHVERVVWPAATSLAGEVHAVASFRTPGWGPQPSAGFVLAVRRGDEIVASLDGAIGDAGTQSAPLVADVGT